MVLLHLLGCQLCGDSEIRNTGYELVGFDGGGESVDGAGGEECGLNWGSWGSVWTGDLSSFPDGPTTQLYLDPGIGDFLLWEIDVYLPFDRMREGESLSFDDGDFWGSPCYVTDDGCQLTLDMSYGEIEVLAYEQTEDDPCDPFSEADLHIRWDLEFGEVGSDTYWVTSSGKDHIPIFLDYLCWDPNGMGMSP